MKKDINLDKIMGLYRELDNLTSIDRHYTKLSDEEIRERIERKRIEIAEEEEKTIGPRLAEAQARARVRRIEAEDIVESLQRIERKLDLPKKYMQGVKVRVDPCSRYFSPAYRGSSTAYRAVPMSTQFVAVYRNGWRLTGILRDECTARRFYLELPEETQKKIIKKFEKLEY